MESFNDNNICSRFLSKFRNYMFLAFDDEVNHYDFFKKSTQEKIIMLNNINLAIKYNEIARAIMKYNIQAFFNSNKDRHEFTVEAGSCVDEIFSEFGIHEKGFRIATKKFYKKMLKQDYIKIISKYHDAFSLKFFLLDESENIYGNFDYLFKLMKDMKLKMQDQVYLILYIMNLNIKRGILDNPKYFKANKNNENLKSLYNLHQRINEYYITPLENDEEIDYDNIYKVLQDMNYENASIMFLIRDEQTKKGIKVPTEIKIKKPKDTKKLIDKATYHDTLNIIHEYYDTENNKTTRILKSDEINYVVFLMKGLNFSTNTIETFIRTSLKNHKNINPIDRYLDLSKKIEYFKTIKDIENLDKTLKDLLKEYSTSSGDEKEFWLDSFKQELELLENAMKNDYSYELSLKKGQD